MHQLQDFELTVAAGDELATSFAGLPNSLTRLELRQKRDCSHPGAPREATLPARLTHLSCLLQLRLDGCRILPELLASMPQLQRLVLSDCTLLPCGPDGRVTTDGAAALFSAIQRLTQLQRLSLFDFALNDAGLVPLGQFFCLTAASSALTELQLIGVKLPAEALLHMFPAGKTFSAMRELCLWGEYQSVGPIGAGELSRIFSCCPGLEALTVPDVVPPGTDLGCLLQLPQTCSRLELAGNAVDDAAAAIIAQLTQLTSLSLGYSDELSGVGLRQLTVLRSLKQLKLAICDPVSVEYKAGAPRAGQLELNRGDAQVGTAVVVPGRTGTSTLWPCQRLLLKCAALARCSCVTHGAGKRSQSLTYFHFC